MTELHVGIDWSSPLAAQPKAVVASETTRVDRSAAVWIALGQSLVEQNHVEQSLLCYKAALACEARNAAAFAARGLSYFHLGRYVEAMEDYIAALQIDPTSAGTWTNLGVLYQTIDCLDEAISCLETALLHDANSPEAWANLGRSQFANGDFGAAITSFTAALALKPGDARLHFDRSLVMLASGEWQDGWRAYEARLKLNVQPRVLTQCFPLWQGEPLAGKRVLALSEQGIGDVFQFVRFVRHLTALGAEVTLHVQSHLKGVLDGFLVDCTVIDHFDANMQFDFEVPIMSLPLRLGGIEALARFSAYIAAEDARVALWDARLTTLVGAKRRIGIAWQGNPSYSGDARRSLPLSEFKPLAGFEDVALVSLQKHVGLDQIESAGVPLVELGADVDSDGAFVDTAAIIASLDLVITSDSAVAHLAGAMGKPVWLLLNSVPDWRWGRVGTSTPWYPTMRLFRQTEAGNWSSVMADVAKALAE